MTRRPARITTGTLLAALVERLSEDPADDFAEDTWGEDVGGIIARLHARLRGSAHPAALRRTIATLATT
jgi:hypothetical protein